MNKIGILTFYKSVNYGSALQAWALQHVLERNGYDVEIIEYTPEAYDHIYGLFVPPCNLKSIKYDKKRLLLANAILRQKSFFKNFRDEYMNLSNEKYTKDSCLTSMVEKYDCVVCGSDQIWNVRAHDCDIAYFLPVKSSIKKIAYAVSVNDTDFTENMCDENLRKCIKDFFAISARERSGALKIGQFIGEENRVQTVVDPTLLNSKEEYGQICAPRFVKEKYIFLYNVWSDNDAVNAAIYLSKKMNMPIYAALMKRDVKVVGRLRAKGIHVETKHTSPEDFVSLIRYADFIVTDSFHGTAFSLIFEKEFISINERVEKGKKNDERILSILNRVGLENRYLTLDELSKTENLDAINYSAVNIKKKNLRDESERWLRNSIVEGVGKNEDRKN